MTEWIDVTTNWATANPWPAAIAAGLPAAVLLTLVVRGTATAWRRVRRRVTVPVAMAGFGAVLATALSGDTAWRFASAHLGISADWERLLIFAVGEVALFSFALAARSNLHEKGRTGVPGLMVWVTCAALAVPAIAVSDNLAAAFARIIFGPCAAAVLWHMAMGIELRQSQPKEARTSFLAVIANEFRERTLARFGLSEGNRTAQQIIQERATVKAAVLAERLHALKPTQDRRRAWTLRRLRKHMLKAGIPTDSDRRHEFLDVRSHLQHAAGPAVLPDPWQSQRGPGVKGEGVHPGPEVKADQAPEPSPAAGVNGRAEVVKTPSPVNGEDGQPGEEVNEPSIPVKAELVKTTGVNGPAGPEANAFTLHPYPTAEGTQNRVEHARPRLTDPAVHPASTPEPFTFHGSPSQQVTAVNEGVKASGEETRFTGPEGQHDDMSIHPAVAAAPFHPAAEARFREVKTATAVPTQAGPVDPSPLMSSPWAVKDEAGVKGEGVHPGPEVKADQAPEPSPAAGVNGRAEVVKAHTPVNGEEAGVKGEGELSPEQARKIIESAWWGGEKTNAETAREAQRSAAYVTKVWKALEKDHGARPAPDQAAVSG